MALAEENGSLSNLARHVGTFASQLFKHGEESSPKISLVKERKVAVGSAYCGQGSFFARLPLV